MSKSRQHIFYQEGEGRREGGRGKEGEREEVKQIRGRKSKVERHTYKNID
jgi:hypothetical protein